MSHRAACIVILLIPIPRDLVRAGLSSRCSRRPGVPDVLLRLASKKRWVNPCIRCPPSRPQAREEDSWKRRDVKLHAHLSLAKSQKLEAHDKLQDPRTSSGSVCPLCILPILDPQSTAKSSSPEPEASAESMCALSSRRFVQGSKKNKPRSCKGALPKGRRSATQYQQDRGAGASSFDIGGR